MSVHARGDRGFTLLEVMIALAIVGIAVVTVIELSGQSLRLVKTSGEYQQAAQLADRIATDTQATDEAVDAGEEGPFQWERRISMVPLPEELQPKETVPGKEPAKLFAVVIDVRWGRNHGFQLATLRTPTSTPTTSASPSSTAPGVQSPGTSTPGTSTPGTSTPGTSTPSTSTPSRSTPSTSTPGMSTPRTPASSTPFAGTTRR